MLIKNQFLKFSTFKTLMRFEKQSINWRNKDFIYHSSAFANGLIENDITKTALFWMDSSHSVEYITALTGC